MGSNDLGRYSNEYKDLDSPIIGGQDCLENMIHHLRNMSDESSVYPGSQTYESLGNENLRGHEGFRFEDNANSRYSATNAWDLNELDGFYGGATAELPASSHQDSGFVKGQPFGPAASKANIMPVRPSTQDSDVMDGATWQSEFKKQHIRDTSTATQAERQAFDDELAARQKAIQEKMRNVVESESRGSSPAPSGAGALKAFNMLKPKASREVISRDGSSKALKMLGLGAQGAQQDRSLVYDDTPGSTSKVTLQGNAWATSSNPQWPLAGPKEPQGASSLRHAGEAKGNSNRSVPVQQHPAARERSRSRSASVTSRSRSRSRPRRHGDEVGEAHEVPQQVPTVRPSLETASSGVTSSAEATLVRLRSNSKPSGYFDNRGLHGSQNSTPVGGVVAKGVSPGSMTSPAGQSLSTSSTRRPSNSAVNAAVSKNGSPAMGPVHIATRPVGSLLRKKTINKADIGEPKLISSTSNVDTVDLPTARTIVQPPLIPVLSAKRRVFTAGDRPPVEANRSAFSPPLAQHAAAMVGHTNQLREEKGGQRQYPRSARSQESIDVQATRFDAIESPVMNEAGMF